MENQILELLKKAEFSPMLLNAIEGDSIPTNPTLGEIIFLVAYLPPKRYPELSPYVSLLPHYVLINMYSMYDEEDDFSALLYVELKKKSITFSQKLAFAGFVDDGGFTTEDNPEEGNTEFTKSFIELVDMCESFDDCMEVMDNLAESPKEVELVLEKMKTFSPTFEQWLELQEGPPNHGAKINSLKEMIEITKTKEPADYKLWLQIYKHCLSGSANEKLALENIASFNLTPDDWYNIYTECEEFEDYRIGHLAIKNLQEQKANFHIWFHMLIDTLPLEENQTPNPIFLGMLLEYPTPSVEDYYCLYEHLSDHPQYQIIVMQKIMSLADVK